MFCESTMTTDKRRPNVKKKKKGCVSVWEREGDYLLIIEII